MFCPFPTKSMTNITYKRSYVFFYSYHVVECEHPDGNGFQMWFVPDVVSRGAASYDHHVSPPVESNRFSFAENEPRREVQEKATSTESSANAFFTYSSVASVLRLNIASLKTWSRRDFGSSTGSNSVCPMCWLYCKHHASVWSSPQYLLMVSELRRSQTPSSL